VGIDSNITKMRLVASAISVSYMVFTLCRATRTSIQLSFGIDEKRTLRGKRLPSQKNDFLRLEIVIRNSTHRRYHSYRGRGFTIRETNWA